MIWFFLALISAFFFAYKFALVKKTLTKLENELLLLGVFSCAFVIMLVINLIIGFPEIQSGFWQPMAVTLFLNYIAFHLYYNALRAGELSQVVPMLSLTPFFAILTSFLILREMPTILGIIGIFSIVAGSYVLNIKSNDKLLDPFKNIFRNKGTLFMLIVSFIYSISINFDKIAITKSSALFEPLIFAGGNAVLFTITALVKKTDLKPYFSNLPTFIFIAFVAVAEWLGQTFAYNYQIVPYVISIKRTSAIFSIIFGAIMFKEKEIMKRGMGALFMVAGAIMIIMF